MANIIPFKPTSGSDGSGPEDPMIEQRVARLEDGIKEVKSSLKTIEAAVSEIKHLPKMSDYVALQKDFGSLKADVSEMKGKLSNMPTTWTILGIVFTTWALGSGLLIWTLTNLIKPIKP